MQNSEYLYLLWILLVFPICALIYLIYVNAYKRYKEEFKVPIGSSFTVIVAKVGDGDGFKAMHVPLLRSKRIFNESGNVMKNLPLLTFRLAGVDAPEVAAFGKPAQPFSKEAKEFLKALVLYKKVSVKIVGKDRYNRLLAFVYVGSMCFKQNVNRLLLKTGMACLYVGKDAKYGGRLVQLQADEKLAQSKKVGMWSRKDMVTPMAYKKLHRK